MGIFSSGVEPGRGGIKNKIKSICIYDYDNQNISDQIFGFNFNEKDFRIDKNPLLDYTKYNSLNLHSYNNLNDFKESVNLNKDYSSGTNIQSLILLSVPDIVTNSPIYFKMYFENKDSIVKKFDLKKDSIDTIQIF